jgi:hypothetical protein
MAHFDGCLFIAALSVGVYTSQGERSVSSAVGLKIPIKGSIRSLKRYDDGGRDAGDPSHTDCHPDLDLIALVCAGELQLL